VKALVTGSQGFLGRSAIQALRGRGHLVRALDLPRSPGARVERREGVEEVFADLCASADLAAACEGVGAVLHLAAQLQGDEESLVRTAVDGTSRLIDAMERAGVPHMILSSSLSVYDWDTSAEVLDEDSPLEPEPEARDGYTAAKLKQEVLTRERCARSGISLTVLRPGLLWGRGREYPATLGQKLGPLHLVFDPARCLPIVHVDNCADAFSAALDAGRRAEGTYNVIDHPVTAGRFVRDHLHRSGHFGVMVSAGYLTALRFAGLLFRLTPSSMRPRLPNFLAPPRFAARYRPVKLDGARFREVLGWSPPFSYEECLDRTYGPFPAR